jgi:hypothetical protein
MKQTPTVFLKLFFLTVLLLLQSFQGMSQLTPHSTLKNFKLPKYNENSYRAYTLSGEEGDYDSDGFFTVRSAQLALYSGDENQCLETLISSELAVFDLLNDQASGDSVIEIEDDEFYLRGKGWTLDMKNKRITIESEGTIRFYESIELDLSDIFE